MKKAFWLCALLSISTVYGGKFMQVEPKEKIREKDLTFAVTFDGSSTKADFAKGNPVSITMPDTSLLLRGTLGFDTGMAFQAKPGENLRFSVKDNIDPHQGTLSMWVAGLDYDPGSMETNGKKRGNIALLQLYFQQGERHLDYRIYEYGDHLYYYLFNSEEPQGWGQYGQVQTPLVGIKKNDFYQITITWTQEKISLYLNGEFIRDSALPEKFKKTRDLVPDEQNSFIGIKSAFYEDRHQYGVAVDDVKIYSRVLSPVEIRNQYRRLLLDQSDTPIQDYDLKLHGVNTSHRDQLDRLEAEFDFSVLPDVLKTALDAGKLQVDYTLVAPDKGKRSGSWTFNKVNDVRFLDGVNQIGTYLLECSIGGKSVVRAAINRPDLSFAHNRIGEEDEVPEIWRPFTIENRTISLYNRVYQFGSGPLPESIKIKGQDIFDQPPQLNIDGRKIVWTPGEATRTNQVITLTGSGRGDGFTIDYTTRIEYDGMIHFSWTIQGAPEIKSMVLEWQMKKEFCQFLMNPYLQEEKQEQFAYTYPAGGYTDMCELWFATEKKGGFAYTMHTDANWIYDPSEPVFFANKATGKCMVKMIAKPVKMPEDVTYDALFIATPTRPLPEQNRVMRFGDTSRGDTIRLGMGGGGDGLTGVFTFEPHETDFAYCMKSRVPGTVSVYGAADSLTDSSDVALYFRKYWDIPRADIYKMRYLRPEGEGKYQEEFPLTIPACTAGVIADYYLYNQRKLYEHPYGDRVTQIYYDLANNNYCGNPSHGCLFVDRFGREIKTFSVLNKRKLFQRTVQFAHRNGRTVMLHNQRQFMPFLHGMADYFFPGEQHNGLLMRNPFGYTDDLSDELYRSEYNRDVLGVGIMFLPALGQAQIKDYYLESGYPYTEAMVAMLQLHDVETSELWAAGAPIHGNWNALEKYDVGNPATKCHLYYEQQKVKSSNPDVRITYYECPDNRYLLFLANKQPRSQTTIVDVGMLAQGDFIAREEYKGTDIEVKDGKFSIKVPGRSFRIVAFLPRAFYPVTDGMKRIWESWMPGDAEIDFTLDRTIGHTAPPSLKLTQKKGVGCFTSRFPVTPGKSYRASVFVKSENASGISMAFQGQNKEMGFIGEAPVVKTIVPGKEWQELVLDFTISQTGNWAHCANLLVSFTVDGQNAVGWFDDFTLTER